MSSLSSFGLCRFTSIVFELYKESRNFKLNEDTSFHRKPTSIIRQCLRSDVVKKIDDVISGGFVKPFFFSLKYPVFSWTISSYSFYYLACRLPNSYNAGKDFDIANWFSQEHCCMFTRGGFWRGSCIISILVWSDKKYAAHPVSCIHAILAISCFRFLFFIHLLFLLICSASIWSLVS